MEAPRRSPHTPPARRTPLVQLAAEKPQLAARAVLMDRDPPLGCQPVQRIDAQPQVRRRALRVQPPIRLSHLGQTASEPRRQTLGQRIQRIIVQGLDQGSSEPEMWRMLTSRADDLRIELAEHDADDQTGSAHWLADYTFTQTGRKVHNDVQARFRFADSLIAEHDDSFGFHAWARQALGPSGLLLGWTPIVQGPVRRRARAGLDEFMGRAS
jgi:hypothetical protein